jgi:hypothetical protein
MPLAEWSKKTAVENQNYVRLTAEICQAHWLVLEIIQGKIGGWGV